MARALDVSKYILEEVGEVTAIKLQKLLYYAQAWSLVWKDKVLYPEDLLFHPTGSIVKEVYELHKGCFKVDALTTKEGSSLNLTKVEKKNIDKVIDFYNPKKTQYLVALLKMEDPWNIANKSNSLKDSEAVISTSEMKKYYKST